MFTMKHTQFDSVFLMTEEMEDWMEDDDDDLLKYKYINKFDSVFLMTEEMEDWMEDDDDDLLQLIKTPG